MEERLSRHLRKWRDSLSPKPRGSSSDRQDLTTSQHSNDTASESSHSSDDNSSGNDGSESESSGSSDYSSSSGSSSSSDSLFDRPRENPRTRNANRLYELDHDADGATIESESTASWSNSFGFEEKEGQEYGQQHEEEEEEEAEEEASWDIKQPGRNAEESVSRARLAGVMHDQLKRVSRSFLKIDDSGSTHQPLRPEPVQSDVVRCSNSETKSLDSQWKIPLDAGVLNGQIKNACGVLGSCITVKVSLIEPDHRGNLDTLLAAKVPVFTSETGQRIQQICNNMADKTIISWNQVFKYNLEPPVKRVTDDTATFTTDWAAIRTHLVVSCFDTLKQGGGGGKRFLGQMTVPIRELVDGDIDSDVHGGFQALHVLKAPLRLRDGNAAPGEIEIELQLQLPDAQQETVDEISARLRAVALRETRISQQQQQIPVQCRSQTPAQRRNAEHARRVKQRAKEAAQSKALSKRKLFARERIRKNEKQRVESENQSLKNRVARAQRQSSTLAAAARNLSQPHLRKLDQRLKANNDSTSGHTMHVLTLVELMASVAQVESQNETLRKDVVKYKKAAVEISRKQREEKKMKSMVSHALSVQGATSSRAVSLRTRHSQDAPVSTQRCTQLQGEIIVLQQTFERLSGKASAAENALLDSELQIKEADKKQEDLHTQLKLAEHRHNKRIGIEPTIGNELTRNDYANAEDADAQYEHNKVERCVRETRRLGLEKVLCEEETTNLIASSQRELEAVQHEIEYFEAQLVKKKKKMGMLETKLTDENDEDNMQSCNMSGDEREVTEEDKEGLDWQLAEMEHQVVELRAALASAERQSRRRRGSVS